MNPIQIRRKALLPFLCGLGICLFVLIHISSKADTVGDSDEIQRPPRFDRLEKKDETVNAFIPKPDFDSRIRKPSDMEPVLKRPSYDPKQDGQDGHPVHIDDNSLTEAEKTERQRLRDRFMIDHMISEKVSLHRRPGEHRHKKCIDLANKGYRYDQLPTTSVIVTFYNEGYTTLLRTVYSILHESPKALLKEIILIDDMSDKEEFPKLGRDLEIELSKLDRVRLIRTQKREGLVRARLLGAELAKGEVLTFLDCHIECNAGWLEPLLHRISEDDSVVAVPIISTIEWDSFSFRHSQSNIVPQIGGFDWRLTFQWHSIPQVELDRRQEKTDPVRTPTMAGGLFAVSREYFRSIGSYDTGMDVWGGENLEMSFRVWMCGGKLEIIPCSIVGHVFPKTAPYERKSFTPNTVRAVEVWLDEYKNHYYARNPLARDVNPGDVTERKQLRKELNCKSFQWYLENIYPDLAIPEDRVGFYGSLHNQGASGKCLDYNPPENALTSGTVGTFGCHGQGGNQFFELNSKQELRYTSQFELCISIKNGETDKVGAIDCSDDNRTTPSTAKWQTIENQSAGSFQLKNRSNGLCLSVDKKSGGGNPDLAFEPCSSSSRYQQWFFKD